MNTTEKIVESYFRICRNCFTMTDVKVHKGNNRQFDLLAYNIDDARQYHVEIGVSHVRAFQLSFETICAKFDRKFFGIPRAKPGENAASPRTRKKCFSAVRRAYLHVGFNPSKVERIWVCWEQPKESTLQSELVSYCKEHGIEDLPICFLSFRDEIIPQLMKCVSTANYGDDALRTLSLLRQCQKQICVEKERKKQSCIKTG